MTNIETVPPQSGAAVTQPLGDVGESCRRCGVELASDQRYCINCGERRAEARVEYRELLGASAAAPLVPGPAAAPAQQQPREDARAISPLGAAVAIGLLLLAVLLGAVIGKGNSSDQQPVLVGAGAAAAVGSALADGWSGEDAWTVELESFTKEGANVAAINQAKADASANGATDVGILDSDNYASLDAGAWVVYSGVYATKAEATKAAKELSGEFPDAKVIEVSTTADAGGGGKDEAGGADGGAAADPALQDLENASPEDYSKKSKKLPDEVGTGGTPPPTDNKAPGGGSEGTVIK